jgi:hypothetical protein
MLHSSVFLLKIRMGTRKNFSSYPQLEYAFSKEFGNPGLLELCSMLNSVCNAPVTLENTEF